jgi:hypothetical protein
MIVQWGFFVVRLKEAMSQSPDGKMDFRSLSLLLFFRDWFLLERGAVASCSLFDGKITTWSTGVRRVGVDKASIL